MQEKDLKDFSDQELLDEEKKLKSFSVTNAFLIGALMGIIAYSVFASTWGMLTLIPLYFIYKMTSDPRNKRMEQVSVLLKERNLR